MWRARLVGNERESQMKGRERERERERKRELWNKK